LRGWGGEGGNGVGGKGGGGGRGEKWPKPCMHIWIKKIRRLLGGNTVTLATEAASIIGIT
jgi:hypothetical protein